MKTSRQRPGDPERRWVLFDAKDQILGRLARDVAVVLAGKNKPTYQPDIETGDHVVIINADKIRVTGNRLQDKIYHRHSGYVGGLKSISLGEQLKKHPDRPIVDAIKGMLPKNNLRRKLMNRLHVYTGDDHPHAAQKPISVTDPYTYTQEKA